MDVYHQAARIVDTVRGGSGTAKGLCLQPQVEKKKQTYAVVCETLRHYDIIQKILKAAQFFDFFPDAPPNLVAVMAYDQCLGRGINTRQHPTAVAVVQSAEYLRAATEDLRRSEPQLFRAAAAAARPSALGDDAAGTRLPLYVRVNPLKGGTRESVDGLCRKRSREDGPQEGAVADDHVPDLYVFPGGTDLHKSRVFKEGRIIIQDKASCLPAAVLLGAVPVVPPASVGGPAPLSLQKVVDACAAPGNKTTHAAALGAAQRLQLVACERDPKRVEVLQKRVTDLGAGEAVSVFHGDFCQVGAEVTSAADGVLLDPSCSASGMVGRVDVTTTRSTETEQQERAAKLAAVQSRLLHHALTAFPKARRVVYSTCSIHQVENESVVRTALQTEEVQHLQWELCDIMPETWPVRGERSGEDDYPMERTLRCDPAVSKTNGFFVACFQRPAAEEA